MKGMMINIIWVGCEGGDQHVEERNWDSPKRTQVYLLPINFYSFVIISYFKHIYCVKIYSFKYIYIYKL